MRKTNKRLAAELELAQKDVSDLKNVIVAMMLRDVKRDLIIPGALVRDAQDYRLCLSENDSTTPDAKRISILRKYGKNEQQDGEEKIAGENIRRGPTILEE